MRSKEDIKNDFDSATRGQSRENTERRLVQKLMIETLLDIRELLWKEYANGVSPKGFAEPGDAERGIYAGQ